MKTNRTIKQVLLAFTLVLGMAACKKDKKDPEPTPIVEVKSMTFTELKALSTGASVKVPDAKKVTGVVISDGSGKNTDGKTVILQEAGDKPGLVVQFSDAPTFALNDQVEINISNQTLAQVNGEVVLQNIPIANAKKTGTGSIAAKAITIADIMANKAALDGTLVTVSATKLTGGSGKYTGTLNIEDASGTIASNVLADAAFAGTDYPVSVSAITGIVRINGSNASVDIRKTEDVVTGAITRIVTENFENITVSASNASKGYLDYLSGVGFTTSLGAWYSNGFTYKFDGSLFDPAFTTAGRAYVYQIHSVSTDSPGGSTLNSIGTRFTNLQGLKTVTITFAGSNVNSYKPSNSPTIRNLNPFDPAVDIIQLSVYPAAATSGFYPLNVTDASKLLKASPQYKKTGEWHTFTYTLPTKAELIAAGVSEGDADAFIANPNIIINNNSTRKGTTVFGPILYDKIEFGF